MPSKLKHQTNKEREHFTNPYHQLKVKFTMLGMINNSVSKKLTVLLLNYPEKIAINILDSFQNPQV